VEHRRRVGRCDVTRGIAREQDRQPHLLDDVVRRDIRAHGHAHAAAAGAAEVAAMLAVARERRGAVRDRDPVLGHQRAGGSPAAGDLLGALGA
jgi:hypothetical protein